MSLLVFQEFELLLTLFVFNLFDVRLDDVQLSLLFRLLFHSVLEFLFGLIDLRQHSLRRNSVYSETPCMIFLPTAKGAILAFG